MKTLDMKETQEFFEIMNNMREKFKQKWFNKTEIAMHRALQFLISGSTPYYCKAGKTLITVGSDGSVYPCRRMPILTGNILNNSLKDIYFTSSILQGLRNKNNINKHCKKCVYQEFCQGGLKCLSYALTGSPFNKDPSCWVIR